MIKIIMLRNNRTIKECKVSERKDTFEFEGGKYFIEKKHLTLRKGIIFFKPALFYVEGLPMPVSFNNIEKEIDKQNPQASKDIILIDAMSVRTLTAREALRVLGANAFTKLEILIILILFLNIGLTAGVIALVLSLTG